VPQEVKPRSLCYDEDTEVGNTSDQGRCTLRGSYHASLQGGRRERKNLNGKVLRGHRPCPTDGLGVFIERQ